MRNPARFVASLILVGLAPASFANPTGASVAAGTATLSLSGNTLTVTNSNGAVINWQSFSIGAGEVTRFMQASSSSAVLNRVVSVTPSLIQGLLASNGRVFLVNPNGITFGAGSQVNVAGLVASTLNIDDANFVAGNRSYGFFVPNAAAGPIALQGAITASDSAAAYAPNITFDGAVINTPLFEGQTGNVFPGGPIGGVPPLILPPPGSLQPGNIVLTPGPSINVGAGTISLVAGGVNFALDTRTQAVTAPPAVTLSSGSVAVGTGQPVITQTALAAPLPVVSLNLPKRESGF